MTKWIDKPALPMYSPWYLVVANLVDGAVSSGRHCPRNKPIGVVDEDFDAYRSAAERRWRIPAVVCRLTKKKGRPSERHSDDAAKVSQLGGANGLGVPLRGC
jgi:hypothetical protein